MLLITALSNKQAAFIADVIIKNSNFLFAPGFIKIKDQQQEADEGYREVNDIVPVNAVLYSCQVKEQAGSYNGH